MLQWKVLCLSSALCLMQRLLIPNVCAVFRAVSLFFLCCTLVKALLIVGHVGFYLEFGQHSISFEQLFSNIQYPLGDLC